MIRAISLFAVVLAFVTIPTMLTAQSGPSVSQARRSVQDTSAVGRDRDGQGIPRTLPKSGPSLKLPVAVPRGDALSEIRARCEADLARAERLIGLPDTQLTAGAIRLHQALGLAGIPPEPSELFVKPAGGDDTLDARRSLLSGWTRVGAVHRKALGELDLQIARLRKSKNSAAALTALEPGQRQRARDRDFPTKREFADAFNNSRACRNPLSGWVRTGPELFVSLHSDMRFMPFYQDLLRMLDKAGNVARLDDPAVKGCEEDLALGLCFIELYYFVGQPRCLHQSIQLIQGRPFQSCDRWDQAKYVYPSEAVVAGFHVPIRAIGALSADLESRFSDARKTRASIIAPVAADLAAELAIEESALVKWRAELDVLKGEIANLTVALAKQNAELAAATNQAALLAVLIATLEKQQAAAEAALGVLEPRITDLTNRMARASADLEALRLNCGGKDYASCNDPTAKRDYDHARYDLRTLRNDLRGQYYKARLEVQTLTQQRRDSVRQLGALNVSHATARSTAGRLGVQIGATARDLKDKSEKYAIEDPHNRALSEQNAADRAEVAALALLVAPRS